MPPRKYLGSKFLPGISIDNADHCEVKRLLSYSTWHERSRVSPVRLARQGFCYLGPADRVRCTFCGLSKSGWTAEDSPREVHLRESPLCPLYDVNNCTPLTGPSNVPIPVMRIRNFSVALVSSSPSSASSRNDVGQPSSDYDVDIDLQANRMFNDLGVVLRDNSRREQGSAEQASISSISHAHYSVYSDLQKRRQTFQRYREFPAEINVDSLCRAGFFCAGFAGDLVICFDCGLMLHQWSPDDVPDIEHARCSRWCQYLIDNKGHQFIQRVQNELTT